MAMDMNGANVDEEADDVYNGILGEIGLDVESDMVLIIFISSDNFFLVIGKCKIRLNCRESKSKERRS